MAKSWEFRNIANAPVRQVDLKRWEYTVIDLVSGQPITVELGKAWLDQTRPVLQQMGDQGWELVQILGACAYFKREVKT